MLDFAVARPGPTHARFAFGGVAFEVEAGEGVGWRLWPEFARHVCDPDRFPVVARVQCSVAIDASLPGVASPSRAFTVERRGDAPETTVVASRDLCAELEADGPGRYIASVRIPPLRPDDTDPQGPDAVVLGLAAAILEREGGISLHAAAIELDGHAVLFVGPSGAGKSTAARLSVGCRSFAFDRVNVAPDNTRSGGYVAWSLPGGSRIAVPQSAHRRLPLAAILRVRQAHPHAAPRVERLSAAKALFAVRESMWLSDLSPTAEENRIDAAALLRARIPVGEIHTVLGHSHTALLSSFAFERAGGIAEPEPQLEACDGCAP
ncbi:MAG TPA: hypothetical protein VFG30_37855 [Polyangiales bacterium]|nr:hypothetical protein [Polyangiales bacterium]